MSDDAPPEADRLDGTPHPRHTTEVIGQGDAEETFLTCYASGRLPHGWLLTGPKGVGKATFAWRAARFLLATPATEASSLFGASPPPTNLDVAESHPVARRMAALSEPGLFLLRRPWDDKTRRLKTQLTVDEVRGLKNFFALSAGGNGRRVVIVDSADELNTSAANALLKELEEPPTDTTLFLISHRPSGLLPTIRSRCRPLRFSPLSARDLELALEQAGMSTDGSIESLAALADGSVGEAMRLIALDGLKLYEELLSLLSSLPSMDRMLALRLADATAGKDGDATFDMTLTLLDQLMFRMAKTGTLHNAGPEIVPGETEVFLRLAPDVSEARRWSELAASLTTRARRGKAVNLDPAALTFDMFLDLNRVAARQSA